MVISSRNFLTTFLLLLLLTSVDAGKKKKKRPKGKPQKGAVESDEELDPVVMKGLIANWEKAVQTLTDLVTQDKAGLQGLSEEVQGLKRVVESHQATIASLKKDIEELKKEKEVEKKDHDILSKKIKLNLMKIQALEKKGKTSGAIGPTLFAAGLAQRFYKNMKGKTVPWDKILSDTGGVYNRKGGFYKAPKAGLYMFTVLLKASDKHSEFMLEVDGKPFAHTRVYTWYDREPSNSLSAVIKLKAGQKVSVKNLSSTILFGTSAYQGNESLFTGFMLSAG